MTRPLAKFRVYPEPGRYFFTVYVWPNLRAMREATDTDDALAACVTMCRTEGLRVELATIHFSASKLKLELIAHEVMHGIVKFAKKLRLLRAGDIGNEERLAYAAGATTSRIAQKLRQLDL